MFSVLNFRRPLATTMFGIATMLFTSSCAFLFGGGDGDGGRARHRGAPDASAQESECAAGNGSGDFTSGDGSDATPYLICTSEQFTAFADGVDDGSLRTKSFKLGADFDFQDQEWVAVGQNGNFFAGSFDGGNHTLKNITVSDGSFVIRASSGCGTGIFTMVNPGSRLKNLQIENMDAAHASSCSGSDIHAGLLASALTGTGAKPILVSNIKISGGSLKSLPQTSYGGLLAARILSTQVSQVSIDAASEFTVEGASPVGSQFGTVIGLMSNSSLEDVVTRAGISSAAASQAQISTFAGLVGFIDGGRLSRVAAFPRFHNLNPNAPTTFVRWGTLVGTAIRLQASDLHFYEPTPNDFVTAPFGGVSDTFALERAFAETSTSSDTTAIYVKFLSSAPSLESLLLRNILIRPIAGSFETLTPSLLPAGSTSPPTVTNVEYQPARVSAPCDSAASVCPDLTNVGAAIPNETRLNTDFEFTTANGWCRRADGAPTLIVSGDCR